MTSLLENQFDLNRCELVNFKETCKNNEVLSSPKRPPRTKKHKIYTTMKNVEPADPPQTIFAQRTVSTKLNDFFKDLPNTAKSKLKSGFSNLV